MKRQGSLPLYLPRAGLLNFLMTLLVIKQFRWETGFRNCWERLFSLADVPKNLLPTDSPRTVGSSKLSAWYLKCTNWKCLCKKIYLLQHVEACSGINATFSHADWGSPLPLFRVICSTMAQSEKQCYKNSYIILSKWLPLKSIHFLLFWVIVSLPGTDSKRAFKSKWWNDDRKHQTTLCKITE